MDIACVTIFIHIGVILFLILQSKAAATSSGPHRPTCATSLTELNSPSVSVHPSSLTDPGLEFAGDWFECVGLVRNFQPVSHMYRSTSKSTYSRSDDSLLAWISRIATRTRHACFDCDGHRLNIHCSMDDDVYVHLRQYTVNFHTS